MLSRFSSLLAFCLAFAFQASARTEEVYPLKKLIVADTEAAVMAIPDDAGGATTVHVQGLPVFDTPEFKAAIAPFLGKPISVDLAKQIMLAIATYGRTHDRVANGQLPPAQDIKSGTLRLFVGFGQYQDVTFRGNRFFSQKLLAERLGVKPGDEIRLSRLEEAVNWVNTNPFRHVKVLVNEVPNQPGKANLVVGVQERRPLRAAFSFDDTGNEVIGKHRYAAALQFGNLWGRDHQGSYQFLTTDDINLYNAHSVDYRIPLESRHFVGLSASYVRTNPVIEGVLAQKGENLLAELRYTVPLRGGDNPTEWFFGANFKESNNNLDFIGYGQVLDTKTDTFHVFGGYSMVKRDSRGAWMFAATVNFSPGNINSRNTDEAFQTARSGAESSYVYATVALQRLQNLAHGWDLFSRAVVQGATHNLLSTEQLSIGGSTSVRGYAGTIYAGENGYVLSNDLMTPVWKKKMPRGSKLTPTLDTRFVGFLDIANVRYRKRFDSDIKFAPLASAGFGLRSNLGSNFSVNFDYGWELIHQARQVNMPKEPPLHNRGHIKLVLAF